MSSTVRGCLHALVLVGLTIGLLAAPGTATAEPVPSTAPTPTVTGTAEVGEVLTAEPGAWPDATVESYQWLVDGAPEVGSTSQRLTVDQQHINAALSVQVVWRTTAGGEVVTSAPSAATLKVLGLDGVDVSGTPVVGATLRAQPASQTSGVTYTYRWSAGGKVVRNVDGRAIKLTKAQADGKVSVQVTARRSGYQSTSRTSAKTQRVLLTATPRISGTAAVGRTLKVTRGTWSKGVTLRQRWYADGKPISGATRTTLTVPRSAVNKRITVRVTGAHPAYPTVSRESARTRSKMQLIGTPRLSGSTTAGKRIKVSPGTWSSGTSFRYSWYVGGKRVSGASGSSLKVKSSWAGKRLTAKVRGSKSGYATFTATTKKSSKVTKPKPKPRPDRAAPISKTQCPSWAPIKGNANSGIYHVPGQRFYDATHPEDCFRTEAAARAAGYRKAKV